MKINKNKVFEERVSELERETRDLAAMLALGWKGGGLTPDQQARHRELSFRMEDKLALHYVMTGTAPQ